MCGGCDGVYGRCSPSRKTYTCTHTGFALCDEAGAILWCNCSLATAIGYKDQEVCVCVCVCAPTPANSLMFLLLLLLYYYLLFYYYSLMFLLLLAE
jgi:hypothetical protein